MQTNIGRVLLAGTIALNCVPAGAQDYPSKAVRVIVPFATGGGSDITARNMSQRLTAELNQQFIVDNRPGAGARARRRGRSEQPDRRWLHRYG